MLTSDRSDEVDGLLISATLVHGGSELPAASVFRAAWSRLTALLSAIELELIEG